MKNDIKNYITSLGADLCGVSNIESFFDAPSGYNPTDIWDGCQSIICFAVALPKGLLCVNPRIIYGHYNQLICTTVDNIALRASNYLEKKFNCKCVPMPCDSPYEYWDSDKLEGKGLLSMKHIAVKSGLGSIGKNSLFISKEYGNMVTIGCILTDIIIEPDKQINNICYEKCHLCEESCPVNAIDNGQVNQKLCRSHTYRKTSKGFDTVECNLCRKVCPLNNK